MSDALTRALLSTTGASVAAATAVAPVTGDGGGSRNTVFIPQPSPSLQALLAGDVIDATIAARLPNGQVSLTTSQHGTLIATWPNPPSPGTAIQLQVLSAGPPFKLQILPAPGEQRPGGPQSSTLLASQLATTGPGTPIKPAIQPGTVLQGRLFPGQSPATPAPAAAHAASSAASSTGTTLPANAAQPPSQQLSLRVLALHPPQAGHNGPSTTGSADTLQATVIGSGSNHIRFQTQAGDLTLASNANLTPGTKLTLQILALPGTILPSSLADRQAQQITALAHGWPALEESLQILANAAPDAAAQFQSAKLPQPGARLTTGITFFLSAMRSGHLQDWLGPDLVRNLTEQNRPGLLSQLSDDFAQLAQMATETVSGEWRTTMLPFLQDGVLQQLRIYLRDRDADNSSPDKQDDAGTRFVVEADISRLGPLQLDGLIRQERFDLIIRSHRALPGTMCDDISEIFKTSGVQANFAGNVSFQVADDFPVAPLEQLTGHAIGVFA